MFRLPLLFAAVLCGLLFSPLHAEAPKAPPVESPNPSLTMDVPPGTNPLPIRAPEPKPSTVVDTDKVEPTKDELKVPFAFVAKIRGVVVTTPVVTLPLGQMLELTFEGTDVDKNGPIKLTCSADIPDKTIRDLGHYVALTGDTDGDYLLHAAQNSPDASVPPVVAQLWVRIGRGPRPPPNDPTDPDVKPDPKPVEPAPSTITAVVYVYEKDDGTPPPGVLSGLNRLNREQKILATAIDDDVTNGDGDTPEQYKIPVESARSKGLPALVVMRGTKPEVWHDVNTEPDVLGAIK